jgi:hypothetical protein
MANKKENNGISERKMRKGEMELLTKNENKETQRERERERAGDCRQRFPQVTGCC